MTTFVNKEKREQLIDQGFCVFRHVLPTEMVTKLNQMSQWMIDQEEPEHFARNRSQGCIIAYFKFPHPTFSQLITYPEALAALAKLGFEDPKVWSGFVISKPAYSPQLYWHQDGVLWDHSISYSKQPQQYFLMYYLVDTNRHNGCLRVIPGSHLKRHVLHDLGREAHQDDGVRRATDLKHPALQVAEDEVDVEVQAGDLVIGDSRLLHSSHANQSGQRRTVLTIWYWPAYNQLPAEVQALISDHISSSPDWVRWVEETATTTNHLIPIYRGDKPAVAWSNQPKHSLI